MTDPFDDSLVPLEVPTWEEDAMTDVPCDECDENAPHGENIDEEMDVDADDNPDT